MTVNTEEEGREGAAGPWGWEARDTRTRPPSGPLPETPSPDSRCAPQNGGSWSCGRAGPQHARTRWGYRPPTPGRARSCPVGRGGLTCCGQRWRLAAGGAGSHLSPARGGDPGRPGGGCRRGAHHRGWVAGSSRAAAGRRAGRGGGMRCGWGDRERRAERTHPRDLLRSSSFSSHCSGRASAARYRLDPFQG